MSGICLHDSVALQRRILRKICTGLSVRRNITMRQYMRVIGSVGCSIRSSPTKSDRHIREHIPISDSHSHARGILTCPPLSKLDFPPPCPILRLRGVQNRSSQHRLGCISRRVRVRCNRGYNVSKRRIVFFAIRTIQFNTPTIVCARLDGPWGVMDQCRAGE